MEDKKIQDKILEKVEAKLEEILRVEGVKKDNVDYIFKLVDVHKDLKNEEYWKVKEEYYNDEIRKLWCEKKR